MKKRNVITVVCAECGVRLPKSKLAEHVQTLHDLFLKDYYVKHKSEVKDEDNAEAEDANQVLIEGDETLVVPSAPIRTYVDFQQSLSPDERAFYEEKKQSLIEMYKIDDAYFLEQILFLMVVNRRLQSGYTVACAAGIEAEEEHRIAERVLKNGQQITKFLQDFLEMQQQHKAIEHVASLHEEVMVDIEQHIKENIGLFQFACQSCGAMVNTQGLELWAIKKEKDDKGEPIYFIWSKEAWFAFELGLIPFYVVPFVLQTSVEAIIETALERNVRGSFIEKIQEERSQVVEKTSKTLAEEEKKLNDLRSAFFLTMDKGIKL